MALGPDGTGYSIFRRTDGSYEVEVVKPADLPRMVAGFTTEAEAEQWILSQIGPPPGTYPNVITPP